MKRLILFAFTLLLSNFVYAGAAVQKPTNSKLKGSKTSGISNVKKIVEYYKSAPGVYAKVLKKVHLALLEENKSSSGTFLFSKGNLWLEIEKPEPSTIILSKENAWVITPGDKELGSKTQVLKIKNTKGKNSKAPVAQLLSEPNSWDLFKVQKEIEKNSIIQLSLVPKIPSSMGDIIWVEVTVDTKKQTLNRLTYKDEIENETNFEFSNIDFKTDVPKDKFEYVPPADAEITEY